MGVSSGPTRQALNPFSLPGIENYPFQIAAKRSEMDQNVDRAHLIRYFLALNLVVELLDRHCGDVLVMSATFQYFMYGSIVTVALLHCVDS